jgi:hypothetical protein
MEGNRDPRLKQRFQARPSDETPIELNCFPSLQTMRELCANVLDRGQMEPNYCRTRGAQFAELLVSSCKLFFSSSPGNNSISRSGGCDDRCARNRAIGRADFIHPRALGLTFFFGQPHGSHHRFAAPKTVAKVFFWRRQKPCLLPTRYG